MSILIPLGEEEASFAECLLLSNPKCWLWTHAQIQAVISKRNLLKSKRSGLLCSSVSYPYPSFLTAHPENNWQGVSENKHLLFKLCLRFPSYCFRDFKKEKKIFLGGVIEPRRHSWIWFLKGIQKSELWQWVWIQAVSRLSPNRKLAH